MTPFIAVDGAHQNPTLLLGGTDGGDNGDKPQDGGRTTNRGGEGGGEECPRRLFYDRLPVQKLC